MLRRRALKSANGLSSGSRTSMVRSPRFLKNSLAVFVCAVCAVAADLPAGADLPIRLKSKVSTQTAKAADPVEAVVIGGPLSGALVHGTVDKVAQSAKGDERSTLVLKFAELESDKTKVKLDARVAE